MISSADHREKAFENAIVQGFVSQRWQHSSNDNSFDPKTGLYATDLLPQNSSRTCPICGCVSKDNRKTQASFKCVCCEHQGNAHVVATINIKERARSSLACGESEKNAQAQVNSGRSKKPTPNQLQESTDVIGSASC